jgi:hypothetical protein
MRHLRTKTFSRRTATSSSARRTFASRSSAPASSPSAGRVPAGRWSPRGYASGKNPRCPSTSSSSLSQGTCRRGSTTMPAEQCTERQRFGDGSKPTRSVRPSASQRHNDLLDRHLTSGISTCCGLSRLESPRDKPTRRGCRSRPRCGHWVRASGLGSLGEVVPDQPRMACRPSRLSRRAVASRRRPGHRCARPDTRGQRGVAERHRPDWRC